MTVKHFVVESLVDMIYEDNYRICLNEDCDVIYYDLEEKTIFRKTDIKIPIWYKKMLTLNIYVTAIKLQRNKLLMQL
ncbi:hypothetical protein QBE52_01135 [Clostridiaceae bacterium 35-E11]